MVANGFAADPKPSHSGSFEGRTFTEVRPRMHACGVRDDSSKPREKVLVIRVADDARFNAVMNDGTIRTVSPEFHTVFVRLADRKGMESFSQAHANDILKFTYDTAQRICVNEEGLRDVFFDNANFQVVGHDK